MQSVETIILVAFEVLIWLIIARVLLSWFPHDPRNAIIRFIYETTEPILAPIRRLIPRGSLPLDFSPLVAIILLQLIEHLLLRLF